jgi:heterodisulfide reductase subunit A-like polyferredoxin
MQSGGESVNAQPDERTDVPDVVEEILEDAENGNRLKHAVVIGGGITGIQAALDLADARIRVTLVEKSPTLGGRMAQLDKTFPTMDCSI